MCWPYDSYARMMLMHMMKMIAADSRWSNFSMYAVYRHGLVGTVSMVVALFLCDFFFGLVLSCFWWYEFDLVMSFVLAYAYIV